MGRPKGSKNRPKANGEESAEHIGKADFALNSSAAKTLRGDIRDALLTAFKDTPVAWSSMTESQQERVIHRCRDIADSLVSQAIQIAAAEGASYLKADIAQFTVKGGIKMQLTSAGTIENVTRLAEHHGPAVLVLIEPSKFKGERAPAETDVVGDLKMPRQPPQEAPGVHGDELGDDPGEGNDPLPQVLLPPPNTAGPTIDDPPSAP